MRAFVLLAALAACDSDSSSTLDAAGSGSDASATDDGMTPDTPVTAPLCQRPGLAFCEDFEALAAGAVSNATSTAWDIETSAGSLAIDSAHARGAKALKVSTTGNGRARLVKTGLALANNSAWGVMHAWVTAFPTAPDYAHYSLVELAGTGNPSAIRPIGGQYIPTFGPNNPAGAFWGVGSDAGPTGDWTNWKYTAPSVGGQWLCLEFRMDNATSGIDVYIDGVAKPEMSVTRTNHGGTNVDFVFPTFDRVWFGWWLYQANPTPNTYDVWLDDLALGPDRIGCD